MALPISFRWLSCLQTASISPYMQTIKTLDLNLLKALNALLDERNVTRAAEKLSVSQPAMSGMLTRLRDSFNDPLFIRTQHGILPTDRALSLAVPVKNILDQAAHLLDEPEFQPATAKMKITLAGTDYSMRTVVIPFLTALRRQAPNIQVAITLINERTLQEDLERGTLDFVLTTPTQAPAGLHIRTLFEEHYVCALRTDHPILQQGEPDLAQFCQLEHALVSPNGNGFTGVVDQALQTLGATRRVSLSLQSFLILPDILRNSDLCAVTPSRLVTHQPGISYFSPPVTVPGFTKVLAWHERTHRNPAHQWLRELMFESCYRQI